MATDLPIRCTCGTLRGVVRGISPKSGNRVICYCAGCQAFTHFLGCADRILDERGGTDIFQTSPARVELTHGRERLACVRQTPTGALRWYADCCRTPLGNTARTREVPFVGLFSQSLDPASIGTTLEVVLGPVRGHVNTKAAKVPVRTSGVARSIARFARLALQARLRGEQRKSPFFDAAIDKPSVEPRVLSDDEYRALDRQRSAG